MAEPSAKHARSRSGRPTVPTRDTFATQPISVAGHALIACRSGAIFFPREQTLIVADLHLEKGSAYAERGRMLPPYDTRETLSRLAAVIDAFRPAQVIALGDSLHDANAESRMSAEDLAVLHGLQQGRVWVWVTGNHDPKFGRALGGNVVDEVTFGGLHLRHIPRAGSVDGEIAGHLHPVARLATRGASLRRRCFVGDATRLVMPAFGAFTGGLNVLDDAFAGLFGETAPRVWMLGSDGVYPVPTENLRGD